MKCFAAIIALAFAATATACSGDNIFCAPGMAPPSRRSVGATNYARELLRSVVAEPVKVEAQIEAN